MKAVRAWLLAAVLVPMVFVLATAAVIIASGNAVRSGRPAAAAPRQPATTPPAPSSSPNGPAQLTIALMVSPPGAHPVTMTVRITTDPPVPQSALDGVRGYLTGLLESLVNSLPQGWTPDQPGMAVLKRAIEDAVPVSLTPSLPPGTHVGVSVEAAPEPARPSP